MLPALPIDTNLVMAYVGPYHLPRLSLCDKEKEYFIFLHDILYLKGQGSYTSFYLVPGSPNHIDKRPVVMSHNLSYYCDLLLFDFAQANQSFYFNTQHVAHITSDHCVHLFCIHEPIIITGRYLHDAESRLHPSADPVIPQI